MALKEYRVCQRVTALVRRESTVQASHAKGIVDFAATDPQAILPAADMVIFSTPVRVLTEQLTSLSPFYKNGAIISDMGSTKQEIMKVMARLPETVYPIGSHPMCGKEQAGLEFAEPYLFEDAPWILTPLTRTPIAVIEMMAKLAKLIRAIPRQIDAAQHDQFVAAISHVPYTVSTALVLTAQTLATEEETVWEIAASGFRDSSRLAASDVTMMLDILLTNRHAVLSVLDEMNRQLDTFSRAITEMDEAQLRAIMEQAAQQRRKMYQ